MFLVCRKTASLQARQERKEKEKKKKKEKEKEKKKKKEKERKKEEEEHAIIPEIFREMHPAMLAAKYLQVCEPRFLSGNFNVNGLSF